jgi:hypothetical protein
MLSLARDQLCDFCQLLELIAGFATVLAQTQPLVYCPVL